MKSKNIRRLETLEARLPPSKTEKEKESARLNSIIAISVAYYLGGPDPNESLFDKYGRGIGYASYSEFNKAWEAKDPDLSRRHAAAVNELLEKFGASSSDDGDKLNLVFQEMQAGLSEHYQRFLRNSVEAITRTRPPECT